MIKTVSVDINTLVPFPKREVPTADLIRNRELIGHFSGILSDIYDLRVVSTSIALNQLNSLESVEDSNLKGIVLAGIGGIHTFVGNYISAFSAFQKSITLVTDKQALAVVYSELSTLLRKLGYRSEANAILKEAIAMADNESLRWKLNTQYGLIYKYSDKQKAAGILLESLAYYNRTGNPIREARILRHLGNTALADDDYQSAREYYLLATKIAADNSLEQLKNDIVNDQGWLLVSQKKYDEARLLFRNLLISDLSPYQNSLALQNIGYLEYEQGNYSDAINCHSTSLQLTTRYEMRDMAFEDYYKLGKCHDLIGELPLAHKYYNSGYKELQQEIDLGLRILGYRKKLLYSYVEYLNTNKATPEIDIEAEVFGFTMDKTMEEIRQIFHTNILYRHLDNSRNTPELCRQLEIDTRTYFIYQKKLGLKRGPGIPEKVVNNPYFARYLDSLVDMDWRSANKKFDSDLFAFLLKYHRNNKKNIATALDISYQQVLMKTKAPD